MPPSAAIAERLHRVPPNRGSLKSRRPDFRDAVFVVLSLAAVAAVHRTTVELPGVAPAAIVLVTTAIAMHVRLAKHRWAAAAHLAASATVLALMSAPLHLTAIVVLTGLAGAELIASSTRRAAVLQAGAWTGLVAGLVSVAAIGLLAPPPPMWQDAVAAMVGGLLSAPAMMVLGPLAEWLFGHTTRLTMGEWLNYEQPLLRGLADAAPGTFQHSVNVGVLAAAAAAAIHADALLARLGGLYHDVGKMRAPQYFIENQRGTNPHDQLHPRESADILRAHVEDGVELVLAHRMGQRIADFVRQHHGTGAMRLLREKAEALGEADADSDAYRYPGPKPRSREIGIVMMADQLEATAHAKPPHEEGACQDLVRSTIERLRAETQLDESGLTEAEFSLVHHAFARVLRAMYHARMDYPDADRPAAPGSRFGLLGRAFPRRR